MNNFLSRSYIVVNQMEGHKLGLGAELISTGHREVERSNSTSHNL